MSFVDHCSVSKSALHREQHFSPGHRPGVNALQAMNCPAGMQCCGSAGGSTGEGEVAAGPTAQKCPPAPSEKAAVPATGSCASCRPVLLPLGATELALGWWLPNTGSKGLPLALEVPYTTICDINAGRTLVPPRRRPIG